MHGYLSLLTTEEGAVYPPLNREIYKELINGKRLF